MRKLIGILGLAATALLVGCGGGGGSSGDTTERYSITLQAESTSLPVNTGSYPVGIGASAPYTTTLYVNAKEGNDPIPSGEDIFSCNTAYGLSSGPLYYLDGDEDHEDDDGNPLAYRSITLGSNAGGNSFHFHAGNQAGVATITCAVTDPRDSRVYSASVSITVGGGSGTGLPASVYAIAQSEYLGTQGNLSNLPASVNISATVMDDAVQPVPNPSAANLQIRILPTTAAATGARLLLGGQSGSQVLATTTGGVANFSLSSGTTRGAIVLELTADRYDNNVANGIQDPIVQLTAIAVVDGVSTTTLAFSAATVEAANGTSFAQALEASGGTAPYQWAIVSGTLPTGLTLSSSGIISGKPQTTLGTYAVTVRVTDALGDSVQAVVTITVTGQALAASGSCSATKGVASSCALTATGGTGSYTWSAVGGLPDGVSLSSSGVVNISASAAAGASTVAARVTDSAGSYTIISVAITVTDPAD
ncbi:MAG: Ig domain-containing protein [Ottowia sp.]|uniref:Ig domain-containing protein n=1 Tax=Ottowia sp. TaxID=1898956 RepID=UPI0039E3A2DD